MKKLMVGVALVLCSVAAVAAPSRQSAPIHFLVNAGLTGGGDKLATAEYTNGDSASIHGGGLFEIGAGIQYFQPSQPFSASLTVNWHFDRANASNGSIRFDRYPVELIGYYHFAPRWRVGLGLRHTMNSKVSIDFDGQPDETVKYKDGNSPLVEVGYGWGRGWIGLRYVKEDLKFDEYRQGYVVYRASDFPAGTDLTDDGSHVGLFGYFSF